MATQATGSQSTPREPRPSKIGVVTSAKRQKTITVTVNFSVRHPKYGKFIKRRTVLHAHDEKGEAGLGDTVEIIECRPLSKTKNWRLVQVLQKAPAEVTGVQ